MYNGHEKLFCNSDVQHSFLGLWAAAIGKMLIISSGFVHCSFLDFIISQVWQSRIIFASVLLLNTSACY